MNYKILMEHYEKCLNKYGDTSRGVDWPNKHDASTRYDVMIDITKSEKKLTKHTLLDFGCGAGHLLEHIKKRNIKDLRYFGADISSRYISLCKMKYPHETFYVIDLMEKDLPQKYDYIIANGVFTEKLSLSSKEMSYFFIKIIKKLFNSSKKGLAFNVMSSLVEWERDDLFHVSMGKVAKLIKEHLSDNFVIRNDYGLYENTIYVYHKPNC